MARSVRSSTLETRTGRLKLAPAKEPTWCRIGKGLYLGYYRGTSTGGGTWQVRIGVGAKKYKRQQLGRADDYQEADGVDALTYYQAQEAAAKIASELAQGGVSTPGTYTVEQALDDYLSWFKIHRKGYDTVNSFARAHIYPKLGARTVASLAAPDIRRWHEEVAATPRRLRTRKGQPQKYLEADPDDVDQLRARKATSNRVLTILKAALNRAYQDSHVKNDDAWRRVRPFKDVDEPSIRYLLVDESVRLMNSCEPDLRQLVTGALYSGCRCGELVRMHCHEYDPTAGTLFVRRAKGGRSRYVALHDEAKEFFDQVTIGRPGSDLIFKKADGKAWGKGHQKRPMLEASKQAKISPTVSFKVLRSTYGSMLALRGVPLQVIANALGHADTRITSRHYAALIPDYVKDTIRANVPSYVKTEKSNVRPLRQKQAKRAAAR